MYSIHVLVELDIWGLYDMMLDEIEEVASSPEDDITFKSDRYVS